MFASTTMCPFTARAAHPVGTRERASATLAESTSSRVSTLSFGRNRANVEHCG
jgi:hypothetical protein